jgi:ABC-type Fe3+/spermidine/putrescine transport system ATPase subunit
MKITAENLVKTYGPTSRAVDDVSFAIEPGEMFFLLGPSGCGKTTVLRMLAGFIRPDSGAVLFDDRRMNETPPQERNTALVFQNYAIWPHLSVYENVAYGPKARRLESAVVRQRTVEALRTVRLEDLAMRKPAELSGGQQQRVAVARALAVDPGLILLDEPLSNLDTRLRLELREELRRIHRERRTTCLYVTHDQEEALSLADRIAVMNRGRVEQVGAPWEIYHQPVNEFVARFMGELNVVPGDHPLVAGSGLGAAKIGFRPEAVRLGESGVAAVVKEVVFLGSKTESKVEMTGGVHVKIWSRERRAPGETVRLSVTPEDFIALG